MAKAEDRHWWYLGLRDAIKVCLEHSTLKLPSSPAVLDAGCGTGGNLHFLSAFLKPAYLAGFDSNELAIRSARRKCSEADIYVSDIRRPELHRTNFDLIISCDVLYIPGIASSYGGLQTLVASLSPGGILVLHLPAYGWLRSNHDRVVHTRERYRLSQILKLFRDLNMQKIIASYRLCSLLPVIVMKRLPSLVLREHRSNRSELAQPTTHINRLLLLNLQLENRMIARGMKFPFGSSILAIAKK